MKKTIFVVVLFALVAQAIVVAGGARQQSQPLQSGSLRYDGVYYLPAGDYTRYIRFYADGTVITVSSTGSIAQIKNWFNADGDVSKGMYRITVMK